MLSTLLVQADQLYQQRDSLSAVSKSVQLLKDARSESPEFEVEWRLSRACFFLGQQAESPRERTGFHAEGITAGERAVAQNKQRVEGRFWLGVNLGLAAASKRSIDSMLWARRARKELEIAVTADATYHGAGPLRVLGRLDHKSPWWLGGGKQKSVANYERAVVIAPANTVTRIYFAELLLDLGDAARAREQLEFVISAPADPEWLFELKRDQQRARDLLSTMK